MTWIKAPGSRGGIISVQDPVDCILMEVYMSATVHLDYVIRKMPETWTIAHGGAPCGEYPSRPDAIREALVEAMRVSSLGHDVRVEVERPDGTTRTIWSENQVRGHLGTPAAHHPRAA